MSCMPLVSTSQPVAHDVAFDYTGLDRFKIRAGRTAMRTAGNLERHGYKEVPWSRGESVFLYEEADCYRAHVIEGLGTKSLVADEMATLLGKSYYGAIAQDTVAMIVNDMVTAGAQPLTVTQYIAVHSGDWFKDEIKIDSLIQGWEKACNDAGATWGPGETPGLKGIIAPGTAELCGSADGEIRPKEQVIRPRIQEGDQIVLISSSGIHANGLTDARGVAERLPSRYYTPVFGGRTYGETLLDPTIIYVPFIRDLVQQGIELHYAVNITGHGWQKIMRHTEPFIYVMEHPGEPQLIFPFIQEHAGFSLEKMYGTYNMGAGFALYAPEREVPRILQAAHKHKLHAWQAGYVEKHGLDKKVLIKHSSGTITLEGETLKIR